MTRKKKNGWTSIIGITLLISGCQINNIGLVSDAARATFLEDFTPATKRKLSKIHELTYAQLAVRWSDRQEVLFLLASRNKSLDEFSWIGGSGVKLSTQGPFVATTQGFASDIETSEVVEKGAIHAYLLRETDSLEAGKPSVQRIRNAKQQNWIQLVGGVTRVQLVYYQSLAFTGVVQEVRETVRVDGLSTLKRTYWIEPKTRSLLRIQGDLTEDLRNVVLVWTRVPDQQDLN